MDEDNEEHELSDSNMPFGGKGTVVVVVVVVAVALLRITVVFPNFISVSFPHSAFKPTKANFRKNAVIRRKNAKHQQQQKLQKGDGSAEEQYFLREAQKMLKQPKMLSALIKGRNARWGGRADGGVEAAAAGGAAKKGAFGKLIAARASAAAAAAAAAANSCSAALLYPKEIKPFEVYLLPNASYHRVFSSVRQSQLNYEFLRRFTSDADIEEEEAREANTVKPYAAAHPLAPGAVPEQAGKNGGASASSNGAVVTGGAALSSSMEQMLMDEQEFRHSSMATHKTVRTFS